MKVESAERSGRFGTGAGFSPLFERARAMFDLLAAVLSVSASVEGIVYSLPTGLPFNLQVAFFFLKKNGALVIYERQDRFL